MRARMLRSPFTWTISFGVVLLVAAVLVPRALASIYWCYSYPGTITAGQVSCYTSQDQYWKCQVYPGGSIRMPGMANREYNDVYWSYTADYPPYWWTYGSSVYTDNNGNWLASSTPTDGAHTGYAHLGFLYAKSVCQLGVNNGHYNDFSCVTTKPSS